MHSPQYIRKHDSVSLEQSALYCKMCEIWAHIWNDSLASKSFSDHKIQWLTSQILSVGRIISLYSCEINCEKVLWTMIVKILFLKTFYWLWFSDHVSWWLLGISRNIAKIMNTNFLAKYHQKLVKSHKVGDIFHLTPSMRFGIGNLESLFSRQVSSMSPIFR